MYSSSCCPLICPPIIKVDPNTKLSVFTPSGDECLTLSFPIYDAICSKSLQVFKLNELSLFFISFSNDLKTA